MFEKSKASPATRNATATGGSGSEKKEKKKKSSATQDKMKKKNLNPLWQKIGYALSAAFVLVAVWQSAGAISNIGTASIVYNNELARLEEERQKAQDAIKDDIGGDIDKDDTSDSNPIDTDNPTGKDDDGNSYYEDENGNVIKIDKDGKITIYCLCHTCPDCGHISQNDKTCKNCGCEQQKYTVYKVQKGDTLSEISGLVGASVNAIAHLNEIENVHLIYEGESLRIPE